MIYKIVDISCYIFDAFILMIFFDTLLQKKKEISKFLFLGGFLLSEILICIFTNMMQHFSFEGKLYIIPLISIFSIFLLTYFYHASLRYRILFTLLLQILFSVSEQLAYVILLITYKSSSIVSSKYPSILGLLYSKCIVFILVITIRILILRKKQQYTFQYSLLNLLMPLTTLFILYAIPYPEEHGTLSLPVYTIAAIGLLFLNIINFYLLNSLLLISHLKQSELQLQEQIRIQSDNYRQISAAYRNTRSAIHDTKKHFFYIQECIKQKKYNEIIPYLEASIEGLEKSYNRINTGNLVIDAFVSAHLKIAQEEGIQFIPDIQIQPALIPIKDYDLCIIIGNLLENSLNSVRKITLPIPRRIEVHIFFASKTFVINIKNTSVSEQLHKKENAEKQLYHGYGLTNVKNISEQYGGTFVTFEKNDFYYAITTVPLNEDI